MTKKEKQASDEFIKLLEEKNNKPFSQHFINFAIKGEEVDFDAFETQDQIDTYKKELENFLEKTKHLI